MRANDTWVVIPAYNEEKRIKGVIEKTKKYAENIIVVDDGSKDSTYKTATKSNIKVLKHIVNLGKGAALKTGCDYAVKNGAKKLIVLDADAQHDPEEIPKFIKNLNNADIVFGYRQLNKEMPFILKFGNWFIRLIIRALYNIDLKDTQSGYRAFTAEAYKKIKWNACDYSMESEMITKTGKHHLRYKQIPIQTIYSDRYKGTTIIDGIKIVLNLIWWRLTK